MSNPADLMECRSSPQFRQSVNRRNVLVKIGWVTSAIWSQTVVLLSSLSVSSSALWAARRTKIDLLLVRRLVDRLAKGAEGGLQGLLA